MTSWPPPLLRDRSRIAQIVLAGILPVAFGVACGVVLGTSRPWFEGLMIAGGVGGIGAGFEHVGWRAGGLRGIVGGALFAVALLAAFVLRGAPALAPLPAPLPIMAIAYAVFGVPFGMLGGALRGRVVRRGERGDSITIEVGGIYVTVDLARWSANDPADARRFLLIHGSPGHGGHFAPIVDELRRWGDVVAFDLPGYGTRRAPRRPSLTWHADVTAELARALWPDTTIDLIGQSFGGAVVMTVVARAPKLVRSAVVLGTVGTPAHPSLRMGARLARIPGAAVVAAGLARLLAVRWFGRRAVAWFARPSFAPDPVPREFAAAEAALIAARPWSLGTSLRMNLGNPCGALVAQVPAIHHPVLFVHGREDALVPIEHARDLYDRLSILGGGHRFVALDGGHMVHYTRPRAVIQAIGDWLESGTTGTTCINRSGSTSPASGASSA